MKKEIESYKVAWNTPADEGFIMLNTKDGGLERLEVDSAAEALLLLDILRNEKPVYCEGPVLLTGFEPVGEGEEGSEQ